MESPCTICNKRPIMYAGRGLCGACYLREWRKTHPTLADPNGNMCRCGCGEECRGSKRIHWISGHKKAVTECMCGCGTPVGGDAYFVQGHQPRPANTGRKHSDETRQKMSAASKGKPKSQAHRLAMSRAMRKSDGSLKQARRMLRKWAVYADWRTAVFQRDSYTCQECGAKSGNGAEVRLEAHHIVPATIRPDLLLSVANGRTLCVTCHRNTDSWGEKVKKHRRYKQRAALQIPLEIVTE